MIGLYRALIFWNAHDAKMLNLWKDYEPNIVN